MKATSKSLEGLMKMSGVDGPEEEGPPEEGDEAEGPKPHEAIREFFEAGGAQDYEGAHKALHSLFKSYQSEDEPDDEEMEAGETEEEEPDDEE